MNPEKIQELIEKYNARQADPAEIKLIEKLIEEGMVDMADLTELRDMDMQVSMYQMPEPTLNLDDNFYHLLAEEKKRANSFSWKKFFSWPELAPRLALASVTLLIGLAGGYFLRPTPTKTSDVSVLADRVDVMERNMLAMLEKESATERLRAVSLTGKMDQASQKVTAALLQTLNNDENVNVRLAALEALKPYSRDSQVREGLIRAIAHQTSPLVQLSLAELMGQLQAKSSVKELEKIVNDDNTPQDVKDKIKATIEVIS